MVALPQAHGDTIHWVLDAPESIATLRPSPDVMNYPTTRLLSREISPPVLKAVFIATARRPLQIPAVAGDMTG